MNRNLSKFNKQPYFTLQIAAEIFSPNELLIIENAIGKIKDSKSDGEYLGQALKSFFNAMPDDITRNKIVQLVDQRGIKDDHWYDINQARLLYYYISITYGPASIQRVGYDIINEAIFPDSIIDATSSLQSIDAAYKMNTRGDNLGEIKSEITSNKSMILTFKRLFLAIWISE